MQSSSCVPCTTTLQTVAVPGTEGQGAFTNVIAPGFVTPALGVQVVIPLQDTSWMAVGNTYFIPGSGWYSFDVLLGPQSGTFTYLNIAANTNAGAAIAAGVIIVAAAVATDGTPGISVTTSTTADFVIPAIGAAVSNPDGFIHVGSTAALSVGMTVFVSDGTDWGTFTVDSVPTATTFGATFLGHTGDSAAGVTINSTALVTPTGTQPPLAGALPTALTNSTTGVAAATLEVGSAIHTLEFPHTFIGGTAAVEPVTGYVVGFKFKIISWDFVTEVLLVGAAGSRVANMEINATDVGTVPSTITIPIANAAVGVVTNGTAVAGANTGSASDNISIEIANGGTAFTAGSGTFVIRVMNMDLADSLASINTSVSTLITALT